MDRLKNLIDQNRHLLPDYDYYLPIIDKAVKFEGSRPDTSIECCNSLVQGISKSIILKLDATATRDELDGRAEGKTDRLLKRALLCLRQHGDVAEDNFVTRGASFALAIATLRNARGDISHGKATPKQLASDEDLAHAANNITEAILCYLLLSFLKVSDIPEETEEDDLPEGLDDYEKYPEFNDFLDDENPTQGKIVHSWALYQLYPEEYRIQLEAFDESGEE